MQIFLQFLISLFIFGGLERITHVQNNWLLSFLLYLVIFACIDLLTKLMFG
ncbi:hypothetical protein [Latilactobacillus curvatus]|nr:hypothetical protein [Latilactobacillus curvatus]